MSRRRGNVRWHSQPRPPRYEQEDTFFCVPRGRLKLRVSNAAPAELIYYERADESGPTRSIYFAAHIDDPTAMKRVLQMSLGIRGVIRKTRELFLASNTRIHIDDVESLGRFIELEVMLAGESEAAGHKKCREMMHALGIDEAALIDCAYIDMLEGCISQAVSDKAALPLNRTMGPDPINSHP